MESSLPPALRRHPICLAEILLGLFGRSTPFWSFAGPLVEISPCYLLVFRCHSSHFGTARAIVAYHNMHLSVAVP